MKTSTWIILVRKTRYTIIRAMGAGIIMAPSEGRDAINKKARLLLTRLSG